MEAGDSTSAATTRLHITPFDPDLLTVIVPAKLLPSARHISYHALETFPEKRYGFVELPTADADRIKKKLNGAVLRGVKISIEKARPSKESVMAKRTEKERETEAALAGSNKKRGRDKDEKVPREKKDRSKKRKREAEEIPGFELEEGRKVKRGWTVTEPTVVRPTKERRKDKKDKTKERSDKKEKKDKKKERQIKNEVVSLYTEGPECLVRTVLPVKGDASSSKKRKGKEVVVHEFANTTKFPSFLKSSASQSQSTTEFVDGVGWVDPDGKVLEKAHASRRGERRISKPFAPPSPGDQEADDSSSSDADTSSSDEDEEDEEEKADKKASGSAMLPPSQKPKPNTISIPENSAETPKSKDRSGSFSAMSKESPRPKSASSVMSLTIQIPPATPVTPAKAQVHPLEALYKRPKADDKDATTPAADQKAPFSFFGGANADDAEDEDDGNRAEHSSLQPPMTPFTRQDLEHRNIRSAAPTPDTAHHSRSFKFWPPGGDEDIEEEEEEKEEEGEDGDADGDDDDNDDEDDGQAPAAGSKAPTSDFQKWFWENRGDLNRSWKKRRKMAAKEKRYRDNRSRASRAV